MLEFNDHTPWAFQRVRQLPAAHVGPLPRRRTTESFDQDHSARKPLRYQCHTSASFDVGYQRLWRSRRDSVLVTFGFGRVWVLLCGARGGSASPTSAVRRVRLISLSHFFYL